MLSKFVKICHLNIAILQSPSLYLINLFLSYEGIVESISMLSNVIFEFWL